MAIDLYEAIMHHLNVMNVLDVSNNDGVCNLKVHVNPSLICMKILFWHYIRSYSYTNEVKWYL